MSDMDTQISIRLDNDLLASIDALTDQETSRSSVARTLLRRALTISEQEAYPMIRVPSEAEIEKEFNETLRWAAREFKEPETGGPINHVPAVVKRERCPHPKSRIVKGQCQACSEYVGA